MQAQAVTKFRAPLEAVALNVRAPEGAEALVKITHCGLCHSDIHIQDGRFDMGKDAPAIELPDQMLPLVLGHEPEGIVERLGPDAAARNPGVKLGDRVAVYPWIGCGVCAACTRGDEHLCQDNQGLGTRIHGGFADEMWVPKAEALIPVGDLAPGAGGVAMCSGLTAYSAFRKLDGIEAKAAIVLLGLGGVGLAGLSVAKALHGGPIIAADVNAEARATALSRGADLAVDPADPEALAQLAARGDVAGAIDFVGAPQTLGFAIGAVRRGGRVVVVGLYGGGFPLPIPALPLRALSLVGSYVGSLAEAKELIALMRAGKVAIPMMQAKPLKDANEALAELRAGRVRGRLVLTP